MDQNNVNVNNQGNQNNGAQQQNNFYKTYTVPEAYRPISAWGYVGWDLLFAIPVVGLILLIVFACGASENINLKKYAQSKFCALLLGIIIALIITLIGIIFFHNYLAVWLSF